MSLPTPESVAQEVLDVATEQEIAAIIRADRLRVLGEVETRWRNARRGVGLIATLRDLRREIEQP